MAFSHWLYILSVIFLAICIESKKFCPKKATIKTFQFPLTCDDVVCDKNQTCAFGCPPSDECLPTCDQDPNCPENQCFVPQPYCPCSKGYVIGPKGNCIRKNDCPNCGNVKNPANQTCSMGCAPTCRPSCKEPTPACPLICILNGTNCACSEGYVIGPKGNCILLDDCPLPTCKGVNCGQNRTCSVCETNCFPYCKQTIGACTKICRRVGSKHFCPCSGGYATGPENNCILKKECPR